MRFYFSADLYFETNEPLDISIPLISGEENVRAWYVDPPVMEPVRANGWVGSVAEGGSVNFRDIRFNPHGHGTHTECLGHITPEVYSVNSSLAEFFCLAQVISILPEKVERPDNEMDAVITAEQLERIEWHEGIEAVVIRTLPNDPLKQHKDYSSTNPPYMDISCIEKIDKLGIKHLLIDQPSVDRELDGGELAFHHAFWKVPASPDMSRTITEMIFVNDYIQDGVYMLELQVAPFVNDAAPSRPVLYRIYKGK